MELTQEEFGHLGRGIGDDRGQGQVPTDPAGALVSPDLKQPPNVTWAF